MHRLASLRLRRPTTSPYHLTPCRRYVPAVAAVLVMQSKARGVPEEMKKADCQRFRATWRGARKAAAAIGQAHAETQGGEANRSGRHRAIPVLCLKLAPGRGKAVVSMHACMRICRNG